MIIRKKDIKEITEDVGVQEELEELVNIRRGCKDELYHKHLIDYGVFYNEDYHDLEDYFGIDFKEEGYEKPQLLNNGWIIPVYDSLGTVIYWINYSSERDGNMKYFKVTPKQLDNKMVFGMDDLDFILKEDYIVWVEGTFDMMRLRMHGIPSLATLGTYFNPYMKEMSKRVSRNILIPDNDEGKNDGRTPYSKTFWKKMEKELIRPYVVGINREYKDVDEHSEEELKKLIQKIKEIKR